MSFLTGLLSRSTSPEELVTAAKKSASMLCTAAKLKRANETTMTVDGVEKDVSSEVAAWQERFGKELSEMKLMLIGDNEKESDEDRARRLAEAALEHNLARSLAGCVIELPLEACKNAAHVFSNLVRRQDTSKALAEQIVADGYVLETLARAYPENAEVALACGMMLREAARHEEITAALLKAPYFWLVLTDYVHDKNFDVSADAFDLLRVLLTRHPALGAKFVADNYDFFFECYNRLLTSQNYVICRESLRLLSDVLLDRANYQTMIKYIANKDHLKILMLLLRSKKTRIQLEAFHVFKVFVANPKKHPAVLNILFQNKDKLVAYISDFHSDKRDEQFVEERQLVLDTLLSLEPPSNGTASGGGGGGPDGCGCSSSDFDPQGPGRP